MAIIRGKIWPNVDFYPRVHYVGDPIDFPHGQPLTVQNLEEFLRTGGGKTKYWDRIKGECVDTVEDLTVLTDYQKTWMPVWKEGEEEMNQQTSYTIDVRCTNCDFMGQLTIAKGVRVGDAHCPKCGCDGLCVQPKITC